jgi:hypothetical protein
MKYNLIIPTDVKPTPDKYEIKVAEIMAKEFTSDIKFVKRGTNTTPDIYLIKTHQYWEIKNIEGDGRHTVEKNFRKAIDHQSKNVIISTLKPRTKLTTRQVAGRVNTLMSHATGVRHIILIGKTGKTIVIK